MPKIDAIKAIYASHTENNLEYKPTTKGMWATSLAEDLFEIFKGLDLSRFSHFADLGSGDGRVVAVASLFTKADGYEIDEGLCQYSRRVQEELSLPLSRFYCMDYLLADLSRYDLMFVYPDKPLQSLVDRIERGWCGHLLVGGPHFPPQGLRRKEQYQAGFTRCTLYEHLNDPF